MRDRVPTPAPSALRAEPIKDRNEACLMIKEINRLILPDYPRITRRFPKNERLQLSTDNRKRLRVGERFHECVNVLCQRFFIALPALDSN